MPKTILYPHYRSYYNIHEELFTRRMKIKKWNIKTRRWKNTLRKLNEKDWRFHIISCFYFIFRLTRSGNTDSLSITSCPTDPTGSYPSHSKSWAPASSPPIRLRLMIARILSPPATIAAALRNVSFSTFPSSCKIETESRIVAHSLTSASSSMTASKFLSPLLGLHQSIREKNYNRDLRTSGNYFRMQNNRHFVLPSSGKQLLCSF